jgi:hypothetical protein
MNTVVHVTGAVVIVVTLGEVYVATGDIGSAPGDVDAILFGHGDSLLVTN